LWFRISGKRLFYTPNGYAPGAASAASYSLGNFVRMLALPKAAQSGPPSPADLPIAGVEIAKKRIGEREPSNALIKRGVQSVGTRTVFFR
jgi:hypothetical protein